MAKSKNKRKAKFKTQQNHDVISIETTAPPQSLSRHERLKRYAEKVFEIKEKFNLDAIVDKNGGVMAGPVKPVASPKKK